MSKKYAIFAVKADGGAEAFQLGAIVTRSKETIASAAEISFVATDGLKMFIVGAAESLVGVNKSDTGFGSTCGVTPAKVQEMSNILISMGFAVDVTIAYNAIDKVSVFPTKQINEVNASKYPDPDAPCYEFTVPTDKEDMVEEALELAEMVANIEGNDDAFIAICKFYIKANKG